MASLRVRLALLVMAAAVPALLFVLFNFLEQRRATTEEAYRNALRVARAVAAEQDQLVEDTRQFLTAMALHPQVRSLDGKACSALAARLLSPVFANIGASTPDGNIFCSALPLEGQVNNADRAYFIRAVEVRKFSVGDFQIGRITGLPTINAGYPLLDKSGRVVAVVFAALDLKQISDSLVKTDLPAGSAVTVFDANGIVLARFPDAQRWVGKTVHESPIFTGLLSTHGEGTGQATGLDGVRRLYGYATLPSPSGAGSIYVSVGIPTAVAFGPATRQLLQFGIAFGLVALAMVSITWSASSGLILRPVDSLLRAAGRLSAGDFTARTGLPHRQGELSRLAQAFDQMAESLQRQETERKQAEADRMARDAAEAANRAKSEFLSRMSHELRTPLNAILGFGQLLEMDAGTPQQRESTDQILKAGRHLLNLIDEVLDIARIEAGRLSLSIEPVMFDEVVHECMDLVRPAATQRRIVLGAQDGFNEVVVMADRQRLKQVLLNLLSNAVKFNRDGGSVTLSCDPGLSGRLRIRVTDSGPGIPSEYLPKLFRPFERLGAAQTGVEGTGLGLALSKTMMEAMGGAIGVESRVGLGSTFWIELPLAEGRAAGRATGSKTMASVGATSSSLTRRVLYIEDNLSNLKLLERVMARRPDVRLLTAMQGRIGLDLARQHRPDLILLDLDLPDVKGDEILRQLQNDPVTDTIPVVILTATATHGEAERLMHAGARAYLTKPFDVVTLFKLVDELAA